MPDYEVEIMLCRGYRVRVQAADERAALQHAEGMAYEEVEAEGHYLWEEKEAIAVKEALPLNAAVPHPVAW